MMDYIYFSYLSGLQGTISPQELPEMLEVWKKNGGEPVVDESDRSIVVYIR